VIHASQGFAVLAHPTRYDLSATNIRYLIELLLNVAAMQLSCHLV
jgi:predicted metal-dependent phosphoesterase TrpH